jgi:hypothetical protein
MTTFTDKLGVSWELAYPAALGFAGAVAGYLYAPAWFASLHAKEWAIENVFVAVFTLATVTAGFGLAIYTFLLTTENGFIGRAKRSIYYRHLLSYVLRVIVLSSVLALASIPGMIVKDAPEPYSLHAFYIAFWAGVLVWTSAALFRAGHLFSIFAAEHH